MDARRAEEALRERLVDVKRDKLTKARPLRFEDFARVAIEGYLDAKGRRHTTRTGYLAVLDQHLGPYFGRMQLDSIETTDVDAYVTKKRRDGLSAASVNRHLNVLRRICRLAVRAGKMRTNPVLAVERLEEPDRRLRWRRLQPEEVGAVAKAFDELVADARPLSGRGSSRRASCSSWSTAWDFAGRDPRASVAVGPSRRPGTPAHAQRRERHRARP